VGLEGRHRRFYNSAASESEVVHMGVPIIGGLLDSVVGILTGTFYGIAPQVLALLSSLGVPV
jgi:hypothetical protein